ncbi:MAG: hydrogenase 4 subunit F [Alicyclobacillus sp.]|nr:hydrogenase 4 subunit F [Alicyclobacillus sp.]
MLAVWTVLVPFATGLLLLSLQDHRWQERFHLSGSLATAGLGLWTVERVAENGSVSTVGQFFYVDSLSAVVLAIVCIVGLTAAVHSIGYIRHELKAGSLKRPQARHYYGLYHLFIGTMMVTSLVNNLGLLWVGIEATTVASAFLVAIYHRGEALEASWKYLILCSAGIAFALLGIILLYAAAVQTLGPSHAVLDWTVLNSRSANFQPRLVALSFAFIMIGCGTKAGLAPLHFWLPDAHSQAPSPISALLSGALLNCAMLGLMRFAIVAEHALNSPLVPHLFMIFGLMSVGVALPFIIVQQDFKRMLAFSTVEHMGIIAFALGVGGEQGFSAAVLQMFNHAMGKSMLFLGAGNVLQGYHTKQMPRVSGLVRAMPFTGLILLVGMMAITGVPPFSLFTSEFIIFLAGFQQGHVLATSVVIAVIALIFAAMVYHTGQMAFGTPRGRMEHGETSRWTTVPLVVPLAFVVVFGLYIPVPFAHLIQGAARILSGGGHL